MTRQWLLHEWLLDQCAVYELLHADVGGPVCKVEVVVTLDVLYFAEVLRQKRRPIKCWHNHFTVFRPTQLRYVDIGRLVHNCCDILKTIHLRLSKQPQLNFVWPVRRNDKVMVT